MSERQGVEIDYCPQCRGIWLDRGELDKIIERYSADNSQEMEKPAKAPTYSQPEYPQPPPQPSPQIHVHGYDKHYEQKYHGHGGHGHPYKKKSLLKELFDFD
jgi:Zn-finger nucleic acid-binding protein